MGAQKNGIKHKAKKGYNPSKINESRMIGPFYKVGKNQPPKSLKINQKYPEVVLTLHQS